MPTPSFFYFDMGNVLLKFSHRRGAEQMARAAGIPVEQALGIVYGTKGEHGLHWDFECGRMSPAEFYARFRELGACQATDADLETACNDIFDLNAPMLPLVESLRQAGRRLGVLSNTTSAHWDYVTAKFPQIMGLFPLHALSCRLKLMKPDPEIYAQAAQVAETPAAEIFFTDDRPENVAAAQAAGWDAVVFTTAERLATDLAVRGVIAR